MARTDSDLLVLAADCKTVRDFVAKLGTKSYSTYTRFRPRLESLGIYLQDGRKEVKRKYTDEDLKKAAEEATSIAMVAKRLGVRSCGNGYIGVQRRLEKLGIVIVHQRRTSPAQKARALIEHLVCGSTIGISKLRKRLIAAGLKKNICEKCGLLPIWCKEPLSLQLDHINGDNRDNRLENLRILCPNCHTQTPTYSQMKSKRASPRPRA